MSYSFLALQSTFFMGTTPGCKASMSWQAVAPLAVSSMRENREPKVSLIHPKSSDLHPHQPVVRMQQNAQHTSAQCAVWKLKLQRARACVALSWFKGSFKFGGVRGNTFPCYMLHRWPWLTAAVNSILCIKLIRFSFNPLFLIL